MLFLLGGGAGDFLPSVFFPKVEAAVVFALAFGFGLAGKVGHSTAQMHNGQVSIERIDKNSVIVAKLLQIQRGLGKCTSRL